MSKVCLSLHCVKDVRNFKRYFDTYLDTDQLLSLQFQFQMMLFNASKIV